MRCGKRAWVRAQRLGDRPGLHIRLLHPGGVALVGVKPQYPLKRAIILPHRMILGLNEINSMCEALTQRLADCQCSVNGASPNYFRSSPSYGQVESAA